ncbi:MAG: type II toxin-antitoxin system VapC family toxin [Phycisphaerae bacterium]|nr:type II toxin-antitoxin system VapC family toxin [Phycisphaerae bacterium]
MKPVVVDASVAAKWFFPEEHSEAALRLLDGKHRLLGPDLIHSEFGNITWKIHRRGLITADEAAEIVQQFLTLPLEIHGSESLMATAVELAMTTGRTVYDSMYVALAIDQEAIFVTADERLVNALSDGPLARHVRLLGRRK